MKKFKWWMIWHVSIWSLIDPKRSKMYHYGIAQGFGEASSYWSARYISKVMLEYIVGK